MKTMIKLIGVAAVLLLPSLAFAQTSTANLTVQATVGGSCTVSAPAALALGNYDAIGAQVTTPLDQQQNISVTCTSGTTGTITMGNGLNFTTTRRLNSGATNFLNYELYTDAGRTLRWGLAAPDSTVSHTGTGAATNIPVYGRAPAGQNPAQGSYSDTVVVTVNFTP